MLYQLSKFATVYTRKGKDGAPKPYGLTLTGTTQPDENGQKKFANIWVPVDSFSVTVGHDGNPVLHIRMLQVDSMFKDWSKRPSGDIAQHPNEVPNVGATPFDEQMGFGK